MPQPLPTSNRAWSGSPPKAAPAPVKAPEPSHAAAPALPAPNPKRTEQHDGWITTFGNSLKHDVSGMLARPGVQSRLQTLEHGAHNALAGAETALLDMKSGVTKVAGHVTHKDISASLAADDKERAHIAAGADKDSLAFKAGGIATHVVVDTAATVALVAGGEFALGMAGVTTAATGAAASLGLGEAAAGVAGRLAVGTVTNAVGSGIVTGAEGGSAKEILKSAAVGGLSVGVGHAVGEALSPLARAASGRMAQAAPKLAEVSGRAVRVGTEAVSGAATGGVVSAATGDKPQDIVQNALFGGALSSVSAAVHMRGPGGHEPHPGHGQIHGEAHAPGQEHGEQPHVPPQVEAQAGQHAQPHVGAQPNGEPHAQQHVGQHPAPPAKGTHEAAPVEGAASSGQEHHGDGGMADESPAVGSISEDGVFPSTAGPPPRPLGQKEVAEIAGLAGHHPLGPDYSPLADRMTQGERPANLEPKPKKHWSTYLRLGKDRKLLPKLDNLPEVFNDSHNHEGPHSGTYDTSAPDMNLERHAELSKDGTRKTYNFEVDPVLYAKSLFEAKQAVPEDAFAYYAARMGTADNPRNQLGRMTVGKRTVTVEPPGILTTTGEYLVKPGDYPRSHIEKLLGHPIQDGVKELQFMSSPKHASLDYGGTEMDNHHIDLVSDYAGAHKDDGKGEQMLNGLHIGLAGNNPFDPKTWKEAYKSFLHANRAESRNGLDKGSLKVAGFGELTIAKEMVKALSKAPSLSKKVIRDISQAISAQKYAGGITTIHMDASESDMIPQLTQGVPNVTTLKTQGQAENLQWMKQLLKENEEQEFIWAHIGAAVTQTVPDGYVDMIDNMLKEHPNLKIDTSWKATADMISGREFGDKSLNQHYDPDRVDAWAQLVAKHPDKFLWGSDNIAASQAVGRDTVKETLDYFNETGLLGRIEHHGGKEALDKFLNSNFDETIGKSADRVSKFRTDKENVKWLEAGGPSEKNGMVPPNQWNKDKQGEWVFEPSATLPNNGNKDTYIMKDGQEPSKGPNAEWTILDKNGYVLKDGSGRMTGDERTEDVEYDLNPARFDPDD